MADQAHRQDTTDSSALQTGYRWLATLFAVLIVVQAFLGTRGVFNSSEQENLITGHGHLANGMFLMIAIQTVLAWLLYTRGVIAMRELVMNGLLVVLTTAQIGLGYSTRGNFLDAVSMHIPNGVLLMGVSAIVAAMAWRLTEQSGRTSPAS